jgi:cytochrome P450 family 6
MLVEALALVAGLLAVVYFYLQYKWTYWTNLGVKCPPNVFPMGNNPIFHQDVFLARKNFNDLAREQYELLKGEKFYGTYALTRPVLVLMDPEIMKQVMVKDFNNFVDRNRSANTSAFSLLYVSNLPPISK